MDAEGSARRNPTLERVRHRVVHEGWGRSTHMTRYLAFFFAAGTVLGLAGVMVPHASDINEPAIATAALSALPCAIALWWFGAKLPLWSLHAFVIAGTAIISVSIHFGGSSSTASVSAVFYIWVALFSFTFFPGRAALAHLAVIAVLYGLVLISSGNGDSLSLWVMMMGTLGITGYVVGRLARQNASLALTDALSGLPNRRSFDHMLALELERAEREERALCVAVLDLDNFKHVNDTLGHGVGDELLRVCASRLARCVRGDDTIARLGGDEFALILHDGNARAIDAVAQRILDTLRDPVALGGHQITVSASIGFAYAEPGCAAADLVRNADLAMYVAKTSPLARYEVFDTEMHERAVERLELETALVDAVRSHAITVEFQPIVSITDGSIEGVEALARWHHPTRGIVKPEVFIPIAERTGIIGELGEHVFEQACRAARRLQTVRPDLSVTVNISPVQLTDPDLAARFKRILDDCGIDPRTILFEVTESALMQDFEATAERLRELKMLGVRVAVDDFGTGHSSLSYLRAFPVDVIKLDRSFIAGLDDGGAQLARAVIRLGAMLGLDVIAEGIESQSQLDELAVIGCLQGQGFVFAEPMSEEQIAARLGVLEDASQS